MVDSGAVSGEPDRSDLVGSVKDSRVAPLRALTGRAGRRDAGRCVLEGRTLVAQAFAAGAPLEAALRAESADGADDEALTGRLHAAGIVVHRVRDGVLRQVAGASRPVAWVAAAVLPAEAGPRERWGEFAVVCDGVADPGNLGTLVRSARALGVDDLVLTDPDTDLSSRRVLDASRGSVLAMRTRRYPDAGAALAGLRAAGFQVVATSPRGRQLQSLAELDGRPVALVVGGETDGVCSQVERDADLLVAIPMAGSVESLNVGVAAGIGIYELRTKMVLSMIDSRIRGTIGRDVAVAGRFIRDALDAATQAAAGLSSEQVIGLMVVVAERRTLLPELVRDLGVADPAAVLAPLAERGWLDVRDDGVVATPAGEQALAALWPVQQQVEHRLLEGLDDEERATLRSLLHRVQTNAMSVLAEKPRPGATPAAGAS